MRREELPPGMHFVNPEETEQDTVLNPPPDELSISTFEQALKDMAESVETESELEVEENKLPQDQKDVLSIILYAQEKEIADRSVTHQKRKGRGPSQPTEERITSCSQDDCALRVVPSDNFENIGGKRAELIYPVITTQDKPLKEYAITSIELVKPELMSTDPQEANRLSASLNGDPEATIENNKTTAENVFIGPEAKLRSEQLDLLYELSEQDVIRGDKFPSDRSIEELLAEPSESFRQQ